MALARIKKIMNIRGQMRIPPLEAEAHRFSVGQIVRMKGRLGIIPMTDDIFRITGTLPARDNILQYRVRNDGESYERVAAEDNLELVGTGPEAPAASSATWSGLAAGPPVAAKSGHASSRSKSRK